VLAKEFYFNTLKSHFGTLKRLKDVNRFSADVKCEALVMVQFDGPTMFVSNEHPYGNETFLRRVYVVCADRAQADYVEKIWVCKSKEEVDGVVEGSGNEGNMVIKK
jgi:hypothetical protein